MPVWMVLSCPFTALSISSRLPAQFHPVLGPVLMVTYACLSNTLLLTGESKVTLNLGTRSLEPSVLVSILSNTFAKISEDAAAEAMFRKAVSTIEG